MQVRLRKLYGAVGFYEAGTTSRAPLSLRGIIPFTNSIGIPYSRVCYIISAFSSSCILLFSVFYICQFTVI